MAQLVVAAAGAAVGFATFGAGTVLMGMSGAQLGWMAGSMLGSAFAPTQKSQGPKLSDLSVSGSAYGQTIPWIAGHPRVSGQIVWASAKREIATTESAGKGGGGSEYTSYTYEVDLLILLSDNEIPGVSRIWSNGELVYDGTAKAGLWSRLTGYTGGASQLPDPTYEAAVGIANAPAYRGRGSVFIESLQLGGGGQLPNLTFEPGALIGGEWSALTLPNSLSWQGIAYGNGAYVAIAYNAPDYHAIRSTDNGATWTQIYLPTHPYWSAITFADGKFVAIGYSATVAVSSDGISWVTGLLGSSNNWNEICYGNGVFVVSTRAGTNVIYVAANPASTWQTVSFPIGDYGIIAYGNGIFVLVKQTSNIFYTSTDAIAWTARTFSATYSSRMIVFGNGIFLIFFSGGTYLRSTDGITWTTESASLATIGINGVTFGNGLFMLISEASGTSFNAYTSTDGISWTASTLPYELSNPNVVYGDRAFIAIEQNATTAAIYKLLGKGVTRSLDSTVSELCEISSLSPSQFDVTALSAITRPVRALANASVSNARTILETLASTYHFDAVLSDKIYFKPRGAASAATITFDELGVMLDSTNPPDPLPLTLANELEIPAQIALTYSNVDGDYQTDTQYSDRLLTGMESTSAMQVPLGFTASEAKAIADTLLMDGAVSALTTTITLDTSRAALEPLDVITVTDEDATTYRMRIVKRTDAGGVTTLQCVADNASVLTQAGVTEGGTTGQTEVFATSAAVLELLDIPLLSDSHNSPGHYVAVKGENASWKNGALFESADNVTYTQNQIISGAAVMGTCTTTLGNWLGGNFADETNTLTVNVGYGELSSVTHEAMLSNQSTSAALVGSEIIQFREAALVSAGVYTLRGLLRGRKGTEWAIGTHAASERFVKLSSAGVRYVTQTTQDIGTLIYFKAVSAGMALSSATAKILTLQANALKPLRPSNIRVNTESADTVITWDRRTRVAENWLLGSVPLGESAESWGIDVLSGATVKRTLTSTTATATYTNAQRWTDFGGDAVSATFAVHQISAYVGRGDGVSASSSLPSTTPSANLSSLTLVDKVYPVCYAGSTIIATQMSLSGPVATHQTLESTNGGATLTQPGGGVFLSKEYAVGRSDGVYVSLPWLQVPNSSFKEFEVFSRAGEISIMRGVAGSTPRYAVTSFPLGNDPVGIGCNGTNFYALLEGNHIWKSTDGDTWTDTGAAAGFPYTLTSSYSGNAPNRNYTHVSNLHWTGAAWLFAFSGKLYRTTDSDALTGWTEIPWAGLYFYGPGKFVQTGSVILAALYSPNAPSTMRFERSTDDGATWITVWNRGDISLAVLPFNLTLAPPIAIDGEFVASTSNGEYRRIYSTSSGTVWTVGANDPTAGWSTYIDQVSTGTDVLGYSRVWANSFIYSTNGMTYAASTIV